MELVVWLRVPHSAWLRRVARMLYSDSQMPYPFRFGFILAPELATALLVFALALAVPAKYGIWLAMASMALLAVTFVLTYHLPTRLQPRWFSEDLKAGLVTAVRPSALDWVVFVVAVPVVVLGFGGFFLLAVIGKLPT